MRRDYELGFILHPEVSEEQTRAILDRIEQIATTNGGQIIKVNQWGRRALAYHIARNRDGYYVFIDSILTPEAITELERTLRVSEEVLRYMLKRRDPKNAQKDREERAEREARALAAAQEAAANAAAQEAAASIAAQEAATAQETATPEAVADQEAATIAAHETASADEVGTETEAPVAIEKETEAPATKAADSAEAEDASPAITNDAETTTV